MSDRRYIWILILLVFLTGISGIVGNIATNAIPQQLQEHTWIAWPVFGVLLILIIVLTIWQTNFEKKTKKVEQQKTLEDEQFDPQPKETKDIQLGNNPENKKFLSGVVNWGNAPDVSAFYGRNRELTILQQWVQGDHCKLVGVLGIGGIGKTTLVAKLINNVQADFDYIYWQSLRNAPPFRDILIECIHFFSERRISIDQENNDEGLIRLLDLFRRNRCLLILDNYETVLADSLATTFQDDSSLYFQLLKLVGETKHQSCIIITSREKPGGLGILEGKSAPVQFLEVGGLRQVDCRKIFKDKGLRGTTKSSDDLSQRYSGNPLILKMVSETIKEVFSSNVDEFLGRNIVFFDGIDDILTEQLNRLSFLEKFVINWLVIEREAVSFQDLSENFIQYISDHELIEVAKKLRGLSMVEITDNGFTLQNVVLEFLTKKLIADISSEIIQDKEPILLNSYSIMKAQSKEYIRKSQIRLIITQIIEKTLPFFKSKESYKEHLVSLVYKNKFICEKPGYFTGNIINLLTNAKIDISNLNFSGLYIWQAYFQGIKLVDVDFSSADLSKSVFSKVFGSVLSVAIDSKGKQLASGNSDGIVRLWNINNGTITKTLSGHDDWVLSVDFSPDGEYLVSGSEDKTLRIWNLKDGTCIKSFHGHENRVWSVIFSPDGKLVISGSDDNTIKVWDIGSGKCLKTLVGHTNQVWSVSITQKGNVLASASDDETIKIWDLESGQNISTLHGHTDQVMTVDFSPNGEWLLSGGNDNVIKIWDLESGKCINNFHGHTSTIYSAKFSPDGKFITSSSNDQTIRIWNIASGQCVKLLQGHTNRIWSIDYSPDGLLLASGSDDHSVRLWDTNDGRCIKILEGYSNPIWAVDYSPDGALIASGGDDRILRLWNSEGENVSSMMGHLSPIRAVAFSQCGKFVASSGEDLTVRIWDIEHSECVKTLHGHEDRIRSIKYSPDNKYLVSASNDETIRVWEIATGNCIQIMKGHTSRVWSISFNKTGEILASGSDDQTVRIWDFKTGECKMILHGHKNQVRPVAVNQNKVLMASGGEDQNILLWNYITGQLEHTLIGHSGRIWALDFSPDGELLVSASDDKTIRLWSMSTFENIVLIKAHQGPIRSLCFNPRGNLIVSGSDDETIKIWEIKSGNCVSTFQCQKPYEGLNIKGVKGLTLAEQQTLIALGAKSNS